MFVGGSEVGEVEGGAGGGSRGGGDGDGGADEAGAEPAPRPIKVLTSVAVYLREGKPNSSTQKARFKSVASAVASFIDALATGRSATTIAIGQIEVITGIAVGNTLFLDELSPSMLDVVMRCEPSPALALARTRTPTLARTHPAVACVAPTYR